MSSVSKSVITFTKLWKNLPSLTNIRKCTHEQIRLQSITSINLVYSEYGDPKKVIRKQLEQIPNELKPNEVLVKMLAAPINPADINTIEGKYPSKPPLPAVAGNEGVAEVIQTGSAVRYLTAGDRIVPLKANLGTWRTHAVFPENFVFKVPKTLGLIEAATLTVNPCTAYRMLNDFISLKPGDTVIQNGSNSACGQFVIQLCKIWGINTVNIVRDRPKIYELKRYLMSIGATHILTEEELRTTDLFKSKKLPNPRLALNCVGGKNALEVMRHLQPNGCIVTYGGMSREPVTVPTSALIFKNIKVVGYWMTRWTQENFESEQRNEMFEHLITMMTRNDLRGPASEMIDFHNYAAALDGAVNLQGMLGRKFILNFDKCS